MQLFTYCNLSLCSIETGYIPGIHEWHSVGDDTEVFDNAHLFFTVGHSKSCVVYISYCYRMSNFSSAPPSPAPSPFQSDPFREFALINSAALGVRSLTGKRAWIPVRRWSSPLKIQDRAGNRISQRASLRSPGSLTDAIDSGPGRQYAYQRYTYLCSHTRTNTDAEARLCRKSWWNWNLKSKSNLTFIEHFNRCALKKIYIYSSL